MMDKSESQGALEGSPVVSRRLVNALLGLGFLGSLSGFVGTALAYLWPSAGGPAVSNRLMGRQGPLMASALADDEGLVAHSSHGKILVVRKGERLIGLEATCTHLGCTVAWNKDSQQVECPCHGARYNLVGDVLRGPAREPLTRIELIADDDGINVAGRLDG